MKKTVLTPLPAAMLALLALSGVAWAATAADQQHEFAEGLASSGEGRFAILEFRRFIFLYPGDPRVPDARYAIARASLQEGRVAAARRELALLIQKHPKAPAAERGKSLDALIEANKEFGYQPLLLLFAAAGARERGESEDALRRLDELVRKYPTARIAPEAVILRAQILEAQKSYDGAIAAYAELPARYPDSPLVPRALLGQASATEARDGAKPNVLELYQRVIDRFPNTTYATQAGERLAELRKRVVVIKRQFPAQNVKPFKVLRTGYLRTETRYDVQIEIADEVAEDGVKATREDALVKHYGQRKDVPHSVRVLAYYAQSGRRAGAVDWEPRKEPEYKVDRARSKDLLRDILKDVLK